MADNPPDPAPPAAPPPLLQRPIYIDPARPDQGGQVLKSAVEAAGEACRKIPGGGLIGATLLGVTAAYFAPKVFDWAILRLRGEADDQPDEYDLEVEP